jgi:hypothetical protein
VIFPGEVAINYVILLIVVIVAFMLWSVKQTDGEKPIKLSRWQQTNEQTGEIVNQGDCEGNEQSDEIMNQRQKNSGG